MNFLILLSPSQSIFLNRFLNTIQSSDILFLGEWHIFSIILTEAQFNQKSNNKLARLNSLNQENIYFHFINSFSKIHKTAKKCLWLEFDINFPYIEHVLNGFFPSTSHYYLTNVAKENGWTVIPVDIQIFPVLSHFRDYFMAEQIAKTISDGRCEKGILPVGMPHLSGFNDHLQKHDYSYYKREEFVDELVKMKLENLNLDKRIESFIMENWTEIHNLRAKEDVLSALSKGERDFSGWNLQRIKLPRANLIGANLTKAYLREADLRGANLVAADLSFADLTWAHLQGADLRFANLIGADLLGAKLIGAYYNNQTQFSDNFNPKRWGMVFVSE